LKFRSEANFENCVRARVLRNRTPLLGILIVMEQIAIRLNGKAYLYRVGDGDVLRLWISKQSLLPIPPANHTVLLVGSVGNEQYSLNNFSIVPILCDRSSYMGTPIAKLTHKPTKFTIPLYPSYEWLVYLHSHTPTIIHHNERYWVFTEYDPDAVYLYRDLGGKWNAPFSCWVFRKLPSTEEFNHIPTTTLEQLMETL
jgi:hypothetical protein